MSVIRRPNRSGITDPFAQEVFAACDEAGIRRGDEFRVVPANHPQAAVPALDAAISEGSCAEGHAWADGFVMGCESCERVRIHANRTLRACDNAAIERAARGLARAFGEEVGFADWERVARAALRAAGETHA